MKTETKESVRTTIDLPADLHEKVCAEADKEKRSRHSQMVYAIEKYFEKRIRQRKFDQQGDEKMNSAQELKKQELRNWVAFASAMECVRKTFPEHSKEIDRAIYDVVQKIESCGDPSCICRMTFEKFHAMLNSYYLEEIRDIPGIN